MTITDAPKIITSRFDLDDGHTLARYEATGGYQALRKALAMSPAQVHDEVKTASLLGRGGAGFPAGVKWGLSPADVWPRYLVVNGDESEPGTYKDRILMERDPHQLIEGVLLACYAVGCGQAFLYVRGEMALAQERIAPPSTTRTPPATSAGTSSAPTSPSTSCCTWGAGAYIVGEETALIESLEGNRGMPRLKPPFFPAAKGLYMQPTIVNNVETLSNLPWIIANGGEAFAALGAEGSKGTRMFAVSGHVRNPGVFEVEYGVTTFRDLIYAPVYAGGIRGDHTLKAFIPGGASAPWFFEEHLDLPLEKVAVDRAGSMLGSGAIVVMDDTTDVVKACLRVVRFFARESCGKCTPCREGTTWLENILQRILDGYGRPDRPRPAPRRVRQHLPGHRLAAEADDHLPARSLGGLADRVGAASVPARVRGGHRPRRAAPACRWPSTFRGPPPMPDADAPPVDGVAVEIDGHEVVARKGELLIDAAERHGVYIPRFCYHPRMKPVGMCRMCIVEVDTGRGPALQPSCMLECTPGMKVDTESETVKKAQDGVLEFLLINHPLDCPVCDKGGECPLQDQTMAYGPGESRFVEEKRHNEKPIPISDLVLLDRERCILCDRCTRFAKEVAGDPLIHFIHRGNDTEVNTFPDEPFSSYFSGNTVQICPVGALTATPLPLQGPAVGPREDRVDLHGVLGRVPDLRRVLTGPSPALPRGRRRPGELGLALRQGSLRLRSGRRRRSPRRAARARGRCSCVRPVGPRRSTAPPPHCARPAGPRAIGVIGGARLTNEDAYAWAKLAKGVLGTDNVDASSATVCPPTSCSGSPRPPSTRSARPAAP